MNIPQGYSGSVVNKKTHQLKLLENLYGQKQGCRVWIKFLEKGLLHVGFKVSKVDPCLYYQGSEVFLIYINDCVLFSPSNTAINYAIRDTCDTKVTGDREFTL